jgi:hypothetical protein
MITSITNQSHPLTSLSMVVLLPYRQNVNAAERLPIHDVSDRR